MNTLSVSKTLFQCTLLALFTCALASCGGDSSSSTPGASNNATTTKKRDLISYMYTDETSQPLTGNGIWNYSVATDYYNYTQNNPNLPSLAKDLKANKDANIEYVFATFISLATGSIPSSPPPGITSPPMLRDQCISDGVIPVIAYYALPQINPSMYSGVLGPCVPGETATAYYAGINTDAPLKVVPVAEYADSSFPLFMSTASDTQIIAIANALAQKINSDASTYGLAIDNEKSINSSNPTSQSVGQQKEELFFGQLASVLATGNKFLFLFDAPTSAKNLYAKNKNIVFMQPLYDLDNSNPDDHSSTAYNPDNLSSPYTGSVISVAAGTLTNNIAPGQSVMFVVPASATSTIWDYEMAYNITKPGYVYPILNTPQITANSQGYCTSIPRDGLITDTVLTAILSPGNAINDFLGSVNCSLFTNPTKLNQYFLTSLTAISSARNQNNQKVNYLGAALYAWRISGMNDINAAKYYNSIYTTGGGGVASKSINLQGPPDIQDTTWKIFSKWVNPPQ